MVTMTHSILIVDDNPDACALAAKLLWAWEYQADITHDAFTALELIEKHPYALAIIDYKMPGMNGVELFRHMRKLQGDINGVLVTGFTSIDVVGPALEAGIVRVVSKPVDFEQLMPIIEDLVGEPA
jgi:two-component system, NtrC family, response regulator HydG